MAISDDKKTLAELYKYICKNEGIKPIPLKFIKVGKGGAYCAYNRYSLRPSYIAIDLNRIWVGSAYALCHEVAHQICISEHKDATHRARFKKKERELIKKYAICPIARKLNF